MIKLFMFIMSDAVLLVPHCLVTAAREINVSPVRPNRNLTLVYDLCAI